MDTRQKLNVCNFFICHHLLGTGCKLNVHNTFRRCSVRVLNVLFTLNLCFVSKGDVLNILLWRSMHVKLGSCVNPVASLKKFFGHREDIKSLKISKEKIVGKLHFKWFPPQTPPWEFLMTRNFIESRMNDTLSEITLMFLLCDIISFLSSFSLFYKVS